MVSNTIKSAPPMWDATLPPKPMWVSHCEMMICDQRRRLTQMGIALALFKRVLYPETMVFPNFHESIFFKGFPTCHRSHLEPGPLEVGWVGKLFGAPQNYIEHTWAENESTYFCFLAGTTIFTIYLHDEDKACCPKKTMTITKSKTFREYPQTTICQRIVT